ncbi:MULTISPECIES: FecCD family ABC transporter permease [Methanobacterium]|uniref:Iron ABC transporter permease n=1 Tax=Methanobacterium bryantii TaxID=2161 RepID=A0A2A2H0Y1_METBR|nr:MULTISPECIES: iron ABC transporter permease [Methanobacterium]OEC86381.1 iron ABC transporter permease [Methanobacterium sp. A39]PAV03042.1 iron ABC transporter permease [Methanobacterium bryantii]
MSFKDKTVTDYKSYIRNKTYIGVFLVIALVIAVICSIKVGAANLSVYDIINALINRQADGALIIWNIRIPRILAAIIAGCCMGIEGCIMQSVLRNPLASPYTMGITQGAAFGAAFAIIVLGAGALSSTQADAVIINNPYLTVFAAFLGAMGGVSVILLLAKARGVTSEVMILAGMAMTYLFLAGIHFLQYFASDTQVAATVFWTFGDVGKAMWNDVWIMFVLLIPALVYFMYHAWDYNSLESGEETAKGLGVNTERIRLHGMLISSFTSAVVVAFLGVIGFVSLIAPHIMRRIIGNDHRFLIPTSAILGALILLVSDTVARVILSPIVLPVGIITSFLGAPLFFYIIMKMRR